MCASTRSASTLDMFPDTVTIASGAWAQTLRFYRECSVATSREKIQRWEDSEEAQTVRFYQERLDAKSRDDMHKEDTGRRLKYMFTPKLIAKRSLLRR